MHHIEYFNRMIQAKDRGGRLGEEGPALASSLADQAMCMFLARVFPPFRKDLVCSLFAPVLLL